MSKTKFRESLILLKKELDETSPTTGPHLEAFTGLEKSVLTILEHPGEVPFIHHFELMNRLKNAVAHFETAHPELTAAARNATQALANMGI